MRRGTGDEGDNGLSEHDMLLWHPTIESKRASIRNMAILPWHTYPALSCAGSGYALCRGIERGCIGCSIG